MKVKAHEMVLSYLPANQAWAFTIGDTLVRMEGDAMFFNARDEAVMVAEEHGLRVDDDNTIVCIASIPA